MELQINTSGKLSMAYGKLLLVEPGDGCCGCPKYIRMSPAYLSIDSTAMAALSPPACFHATDYSESQWCFSRDPDACTYDAIGVCIDAGSAGIVELNAQIYWTGTVWRLDIKINGTLNSRFENTSTACNPAGTYNDVSYAGAVITGLANSIVPYCSCGPLNCYIDTTGITGSFILGACGSPTACTGTAETASPARMRYYQDCTYIQFDPAALYCIGGVQMTATLAVSGSTWYIYFAVPFSGGAGVTYVGPAYNLGPLGTYTYFGSSCGAMGGTVVVS